jgi:hypothetical protein
MCYSYRNLESVIINCSYDWGISTKSSHKFKPRLQVTNTHGNILHGVSQSS